MKKSIKRLELNKRTIANLNASEMNAKIGGVSGGFRGLSLCNNNTCKGHTCGGCNTNKCL